MTLTELTKTYVNLASGARNVISGNTDRGPLRRSLPAYKWLTHAVVSVGLLVFVPLCAAVRPSKAASCRPGTARASSLPRSSASELRRAAASIEPRRDPLHASARPYHRVPSGARGAH